MARMNTTSGDNPFFQPWTGPFGVPEFSRVKTEHFMPAYERAFAEHMAEIDAIAKDPAPPTFENTILAYEEAGRMLERVDNVFNNLVGTDSTDELLKIEADISPVSAAHWNKVRMNEGLFRRIDALFQKRDSLGLTAEQKRVLERHHTSFRRNGAALDADKKKRLAEVTERLATLGTSFSQNVLADEQSYALELSEDDVAGFEPRLVGDIARNERGDDRGDIRQDADVADFVAPLGVWTDRHGRRLALAQIRQREVTTGLCPDLDVEGVPRVDFLARNREHPVATLQAGPLGRRPRRNRTDDRRFVSEGRHLGALVDRKSTRLNSSH